MDAFLIAALCVAQGAPTYQSHLNLEYERPGGTPVKLDLYVPNPPGAKGHRPLIVWIHGGGWKEGSKADWHTPKPLLSAGYAIASLDYRLSGDAIWPAQIEDCRTAIRFLRRNATQYNLDPKRFAAWGYSAGGHLVALIGTLGDDNRFKTRMYPNQSSAVQAVVDYYGPIDLIKLAQTPGYTSHGNAGSPESQLFGGGALDQHRREAHFASPLTYITKGDPPTYIVHGSADPIIHFSQSEMFNDALKKAGIESSLTILQGAGHGGPQFNAPNVIAGVRKFLDDHLK